MKWAFFFTEMKATGKVACNRSSPSEQLNKSTAHMAQKFEWCFSNCKGVLTLWKTILSSTEIWFNTKQFQTLWIVPDSCQFFGLFSKKILICPHLTKQNKKRCQTFSSPLTVNIVTCKKTTNRLMINLQSIQFSFLVIEFHF